MIFRLAAKREHMAMPKRRVMAEEKRGKWRLFFLIL
jgi:hypothetical protein